MPKPPEKFPGSQVLTDWVLVILIHQLIKAHISEKNKFSLPIKCLNLNLPENDRILEKLKEMI